ncbi:MAG: hypothetical protein HUJ97_08995, partial [Bacteroidales bacterium]|nr:hypothetical protein [Bacteroidales bacterium]
MKKIYFTLFATFAMCGGMLMTSCSDESKDIISEVEQNQPKTITLTMSLPENESTRTNFEYIPGEEGGDGVLKVTWSLGSTMTFEEFSAEYANGSTWIRVYDNLYNTNKISQELYRQIENVLGSYPIIESSNWEQVKSLFRTPADKIGLYPDGAGNTPIPFEVTAVKDEGRTAVLSGTATPGNYVAVYPYMANKSIEEVKAVALSNQFQKESGNIEHLASSDVMQTASFRISEGNTNFAIPFTHQVAIMKIIVPAKTTISAVSIKGAWGETEYEAEFKNYTTTGNATAYIAAPAGTLGATEVTMYGPYASYRATKTFESKSINAGTMYK